MRKRNNTASTHELVGGGEMAISFFENRPYAAAVILIVAVVFFLLLFIVWPWRNVLAFTLWGAFILYYPTRWLQKYVRRRALAAALILIGIFVVSLYALLNILFIVFAQVSQISASSADTNTTITNATTKTFSGVGLVNSPLISDFARNLGTSSGEIVQRFSQIALQVISNIIHSLPTFILYIIISVILIFGLLVKGDEWVSDYKAAVPLKYQPIVYRFLDHLEPIYYTFFVIYVMLAIVSGIIAAVAFAVIGVPFIITFALLMVIIGLIPIIGRALIYVPIAIWFLAQGDIVRGLAVLIFSIIVFQIFINFFVQPAWVQRKGKIPKPLGLIAYIVPLAALGIPGIILGPAIIGFALALWRTYRDVQKETMPVVAA
jgi:predicted PurR-regulated permease PerM